MANPAKRLSFEDNNVYPKGNSGSSDANEFTGARPGEEEDDDDDSEDEDGNKKKRKSIVRGDGEEPQELILFEDDEFYRKWAGPVLLGPFLIALMALLIIFSGQLVLVTYTGSCGYPLQSFVASAVAICYLFLIVYAWVFLGDYIYLKVPLIGMTFLVSPPPFRSLKFVMTVYLALSVASFIVWVVGSTLLNLAIFCRESSSMLYSYTEFLVTIYWMAFVVIVLYIIKMFFGTEIAQLVKNAARAPTVEEVEARIFKQKFNEYDIKQENRIPRDDLPKILKDLGVFIPDEELVTLEKTLDPEDTNWIEYYALQKWFKKMNEEMGDDDFGIDDDDDSDPGTSDAKNLFTKSNSRSSRRQAGRSSKRPPPGVSTKKES